MLQEKMVRYNQWTEDEQCGLSTQERLRRFRILFEAQYDLPAEKVAQAHQEHLDALIEIKKSVHSSIKKEDRKKDFG